LLGLPHRPSQLPDSPGSEGRPPGPDTRDSDRFPCHSHVPGDSPGLVPVSDGEGISTPSARRRASLWRSISESFSLSTEQQWLSPADCGYPPSRSQLIHSSGRAGRGNQRPVPQRFLPPRRLHCRMSDELFVPESFAVPDGLEAGEIRLAPPGRAGFRAGAGVPAREPGDQREQRIAGPRRPLSRREQQPQPRSHTRRPTERVILCAYNHATPEI